MSADRQKLERFFNNLDSEIVAIIPNVTAVPAAFINFVLVVE